MEDNVCDVLHCEEKLRTTLHCDDKDKLRRKLALLQREYLRTAQRLQRAERLEAVHSHVRTRITQKNDQDQTERNQTESDLFYKPSSSVRNSLSKAVQNQQHTGGPVDSSESRRSQMVRSFLPSDSVCTSTPDSNLNSVKGPRPSPALRLRSRRSRMRWEKRSAEAGRSTDNSEEGQEQSEKTEDKESHPVKYSETGVVNESEELISASESESPSLLLTHWNPQEQSETVETVENQELREKDTVCTGQDCSESQKNKKGAQGREDGDNGREQKDGTFYEETMKNTKQQRETEPSHLDIEEEKTMIEGDEKRLLDSCTLVEGLLFPVEYYVRTTRRMAVSQSHPDMQAVILSQLSVGRHRRTRGRGRGTNKQSPTNEEINTQSDFSSTENETASVGLHVPSQAANTPLTYNSQSSSEMSEPVSVSQTNMDVLLCTPRPSRGRRSRGGRGRGRSQNRRSFKPTHHQGFGQTSADPHPVCTSATSCPSVPDQSRPHLTSEDDGPMSNNPQPVFAHSTVTQHSSVRNGTQISSTPGDEKVYPIFLKSNCRSNNATCNDSGADWRSFLLPSSPTPQTSPLLPLPSKTSNPLIKHLVSFDIVQDFHLPDDQFASLKLHKLRQVALASGVEHFTPPSYNTRSSTNNRYSDPLTPLPLSLSLTPTVEEKQTFTQPVDHQNMSSQSYESVDKITSEKSENIHTDRESQSSLIDSVLVVQDSAAECLDQMNVSSRSVLTPSSLHVHQSKGETCTNQQTENKAAIKTCSLSEYTSNVCTDTEVSEATPALNVNISVRNSTEPSDLTVDKAERCLPRYSVRSQPLLSPPHATTPSCPHSSSPGLPSLGLTPHPVPALTSSPSAPSLTLPPPHSPSTQDLSPPYLSPLPPSLHPISPSAQIQPPPAADHCQRVGPDTGYTLDQTDGVVDLSLDKVNENEQISGMQGPRSCTHMLKAPAGGCLVDMCSFLVSSGTLCVAAAGKWAVCVWTQTSASGWDLTHTWTFNEPVISVFPVNDATGLICVTLGQLEIRQVRMLSCSNFTQVLLCDGIIQTVVGVPKSRVVTSSHSASTSTLRVFTLSDSSMWTSQPLVSPGVSVGALAAVDGLSDALIGTDECGHLFIWNLQTGHLLQKIPLGEGLSHSACLRGYSTCGVLFVLMQHHFLGSLEEVEKEAGVKYQMFPENEKEEKKLTLFSLVAVNPRCGKSVLATRLYPPKSWTGRLCEADVRGCIVVGVSQNGCGCVWDLRRGRGGLRMWWAPESEGWQLARWGPGNVLLTGHHNGDVTLHKYSHTPTEP
ncbi:uncharacterized protein palb2 [Sphaeramia orbicularis]|uniref:uncharacterized protein palb2 n=1 Tax=Sphaeramia orbicularis TaxID=375764 RepID=UPI00117C10B4|nr:partner and localizer of BRCA2 [Sphaeramia orbicularis]